jgi:adenylate cyclase
MIYFFDDCSLDTELRELRRGTDLVSVEPQVFDLLLFLIRSRTRVISKDDLIEHVWNGRIISESALYSKITAVRRAIGDTGEAQRLIRTITRKGLRFVGQVREAERWTEGAAASAELGTSPVQSDPRSMALELPGRPSIAVLAFNNLGSDASQEYVSDGITEDIITELSRFSELFIIARNSSFRYKGKSIDIRQVGRELGVRYVLEGSIRRDGDRLRLAAQLIDAVTGAHRWAERYDRKLTDVFSLQDELARTIAAILAAHVSKAEVERTLNKPPSTWGAYDYYMRATGTFASYWSSLDVETLYETRRLLEHSLGLDPNYARAYAQLSCTYLTAYLHPLDGDYRDPRSRERAHELALKALQLDPNHPETHAYLGAVLACMRQFDSSIAEFQRATALNPNFGNLHFALALVWAGEPARAIHIVETHMRLDPFYAPQAPAYLGMALYMLGDYAGALLPLNECTLRAPKFLPGHLWLAATHAQLDQVEEARIRIGEALRINPQYSLATSESARFFKNIKDTEHLFDGLRKAGLPECARGTLCAR